MDNVEILDHLKNLTNIKILTCHETIMAVYAQNVYKYNGQTLWEEPWIPFFAWVLWTLPKNMIIR